MLKLTHGLVDVFFEKMMKIKNQYIVFFHFVFCLSNVCNASDRLVWHLDQAVLIPTI